MRLTILGTAAAEGWPAPFCRCAPCEEARRRGGPNIRKRAGCLVDADLKIDFGPDTVAQTQQHGICLADVRVIVFSHQHSDHVVPSELAWAAPPFTNTPPAEPITIFANAATLELLAAYYPEPEKKMLSFHLLEPLKPVTTPVGDTILPLPAEHVQGALLLHITRARDGKTLFYGHDSGLYPEATLAALADASPLDIATFDCTYGAQETNNRGHMGIGGVVQMAEELRRRGAVTDQTRLIATHFSHNGGLLHEELVAAFLPHGIAVAYDGIVIDA